MSSAIKNLTYNYSWVPPTPTLSIPGALGASLWSPDIGTTNRKLSSMEVSTLLYSWEIQQLSELCSTILHVY